MAWKLRTTDPVDFQNTIEEVLSGERTFLWSHASTSDEKEPMMAACLAAGLTIVEYVPVWFVLACRPGTERKDRLLMALTILEGAQVQYAAWRGEMFGYSAKEIAWYTQEVNTAWKRYGEERAG